MEIITLEINEKTKAGKTLHTLLELLSGQPGIERVEEKEKSPYNPEFVKKIKRAERRGQYIEINPKDVWESLGLK